MIAKNVLIFFLVWSYKKKPIKEWKIVLNIF